MEIFHRRYINVKPYSTKHSMKFPQVRFFFFPRRKILLVVLFLTSGWLTAAFGQIKAAKSEMEQCNYSKAIEILHQFIQKADPKTKAEATLLMADCYRLQNDMQDARAWYLRAIKLGRTEPLTYFYYAKALRACGDYEAAKKSFLRYDSLMPDDQRGRIYASFCDSAIAWDEKPFAFEVNNARSLNSSNNDLGPVFYNDGIMFVTDRIMSPNDEKKNSLMGKGYMQLVFSRPKQKEEFYGEYTMPKPVPELFTNGSDDGPASFSKDGNEVFITRTVKSPDRTKNDNEEGPAVQLKIFSATRTGDKWSKMKPFFFNSNKYSVGYPSLSPEGNALYFISDIDGGYGGTDIYVAARDGSVWNPPINLGPIVNTFGNEMFPFVAENGDLYFASDGHPGFGGLDIFVTRKVGNVWLIPQNLGKPINSSYDDFALAMYNNDSIGLFSANRPGGRGEDDIYSFRVVGPLPQLTSPAQPAIAAVTNIPPKTEPKQEVKAEPQVVPKEELKPAENIVPVPTPVVAEVKPPAEEPKQEVKPKPQVAPKEEPKPAENIVPVPTPVIAEVKPPVKEPKQEIKPEPQIAPKEEPKSAEKIVPVPTPVIAEVKPPAEEPKQEIKPEPQIAPKEELKPAEKIVPVPTPVIAEVKPPAEEPKQEIKPEPQIALKEEPKPAEKIVPVPTPVIAEVKPPAEEPKQEIKPEPQIAPKEEPKPAKNIVPVPAPVISEVKPPVEELKQEVKAEPQVTPKEEPKPAENIVPVPAPVISEVKPPVEEPKQEPRPEPEVTPQPGGKPFVVLSGCVKDLISREPIPEATIFVLDENEGRVVVHKANADGCFKSSVTTGDHYLVKAMQMGYYSDCAPFRTDTIGTQTGITISSDLFLDRLGAVHTYKVDNIYYDFDKYYIRPDALPSLNKLVRIMTSTPATIEMSSHADCRGSFEYNVGLTQRRATSAMMYVVNKGISASRITNKWYGKTRLVNNCDCSAGVHCTEAEHQLNRRTEFTLSLPSLDQIETPVDLSRFHEGDTLSIRFVPVDFFRNCAHKVLGGILAEEETLFGDPQQKVLYTVQIGAFSFLKPHFKNLSDVMSCKGSDGILRCFVGKFSSKTEAIWYRDHLRSGEFKDAFVTMMDEKHLPGTPDQRIMASNR
jgi:outer membrane protein OmpA-like peptidoglycan-associated protein